MQMLKARSIIHKSLTEFFHGENFHYFHPPLSTISDCEGGSAVFSITPKLFGDADVFLTVSSQLHLEAAAIGSLGRAWTLSPAFRAEPSDTNRHLSEFWMLEAEASFIDSIEQLTDIVQRAIRNGVKSLLASKLLNQNAKEDLDHLQTLESGVFELISYSKAIEVISGIQGEMNADKSLNWGDSLTFEQEQLLLSFMSLKNPKIIGIFIMEYPEHGKPFYMKKSSNVVLNFDLIVKGVGELAGGSIREDSLDVLEETLRRTGIKEAPLQWYLDTRRYGSVPHGGFGIGFDRLVQWFLRVQNIRDAIPFPRAAGSIFA